VLAGYNQFKIHNRKETLNDCDETSVVSTALHLFDAQREITIKGLKGLKVALLGLSTAPRLV
jgi:hypothetical protein